MATGTVYLPVEGAAPANGTANNPQAAIGALLSADADNPQARIWVATFDDSVGQSVSFQFRMPANYSSGGVFKIQYYMKSATSGNIQWELAVQAVSPGDATDMITLDPNGEGGAWSSVNEAVPGTAHTVDEASISPGMDSAAAGDFMLIHVRRDGAASGDTATFDAGLLGIAMEYTTS